MLLPAMRLRNLLLAWVLLPTLVLWAVVIAMGYVRSLTQAHDAYDRTLLGAALVLAERLTLSDGQVTADLPYAALEMLRTDAQDRIFYRVASPDGAHGITGYDDLPGPAGTPSAEHPAFYELQYHGETVRVVALIHTLLDGQTQHRVMVQMAETIDARRQLSRRMLIDAVLVQGVLIVAAALLVVYGVHRGLAPLQRLRDLVRARADHDLRPIAEQAVPREVVPLIQAINLHTDRQKKLGDSQKRFIASASHQLKTPLTVLRAQAAHAMQQTDPDRMRALLQQLHDATHMTSRLVEQLLTLARSEPGRTLELEPLDLTELAREVSFGLLPLARGRRLDLGFEGDLAVPVRGEGRLLHELVANLVHNAISCAPQGGRVTVSVSLAGTVPLLRVDDNGPGLPPHERVRVLEPFYRVPGSPAEGSGLGLAIVKEVCERHGLHINLADVPLGSGLRVEVRWPGAGPH
jgi:two-component system sensor histidine kinase TctE